MKKLSLHKIATKNVIRDMFEGFDESQLDEDYPITFTFDEFKKIRSYAGKLRYAESHLGKPIGSGSSRVVYRVDDTKVLKIAKNQKGIAQNEVEIDWGNDPYHGGMTANVFDYDEENSWWVEMELARKVKKSDFKRLWGVDFYDLEVYLMVMEAENLGKRRLRYIDTDVRKKLGENENVQDLVSYMYDTDSSAGDIAKASSWGLVLRDGKESLVMVDFGLTNNVYQSYYG